MDHRRKDSAHPRGEQDLAHAAPIPGRSPERFNVDRRAPFPGRQPNSPPSDGMPVCWGIVEALAGHCGDGTTADAGYGAVARAGGKLLLKPADFVVASP
jgi:hypothetical protein